MMTEDFFLKISESFKEGFDFPWLFFFAVIISALALIALFIAVNNKKYGKHIKKFLVLLSKSGDLTKREFTEMIHLARIINLKQLQNFGVSSADIKKYRMFLEKHSNIIFNPFIYNEKKLAKKISFIKPDTEIYAMTKNDTFTLKVQFAAGNVISLKTDEFYENFRKEEKVFLNYKGGKIYYQFKGKIKNISDDVVDISLYAYRNKNKRYSVRVKLSGDYRARLFINGKKGKIMNLSVNGFLAEFPEKLDIGKKYFASLEIKKEDTILTISKMLLKVKREINSAYGLQIFSIFNEDREKLINFIVNYSRGYYEK